MLNPDRKDTEKASTCQEKDANIAVTKTTTTPKLLPNSTFPFRKIIYRKKLSTAPLLPLAVAFPLLMSFESVPVLSEMLVFLFIKKNRVPTIKKHRLGCMACISSDWTCIIDVTCHTVKIVLRAKTNYFLYLCNITAVAFLKVFFLFDKKMFK